MGLREEPYSFTQGRTLWRCHRHIWDDVLEYTPSRNWWWVHQYRTGVSPLISPYRTICKPSTDEAAIHKAVQNAIHNSPHGLINTISGRLVDRSKWALLFELLPSLTWTRQLHLSSSQFMLLRQSLARPWQVHMIVTKRSLDKVVTEDRRQKPDFIVLITQIWHD